MRKTQLTPTFNVETKPAFQKRASVSNNLITNQLQESSQTSSPSQHSRKRAIDPPFMHHDKQHETREKRALNRSLSGKMLENRYVTGRAETSLYGSVASAPLSPQSKRMYREQELVHAREQDQSVREQRKREALVQLQKQSQKLCDLDRKRVVETAKSDPHSVHPPKREFNREAVLNALGVSDASPILVGGAPLGAGSPRQGRGIRTFRTSSNNVIG